MWPRHVHTVTKSLFIVVSVMLAILVTINKADDSSCDKMVYATVNHETTVHILLHSIYAPSLVPVDCDVCPGGTTKIESAQATLKSLSNVENEPNMYIFWNNETNDILLDVPKDSPILKLSTNKQDPVILVEVFYSCSQEYEIEPGININEEYHASRTMNITLVPVELELATEYEEDNIEENLLTCTLKGNIPSNVPKHIKITHNNESNPVLLCVNKTVCEVNVSQATISNAEGYYFCSASIKDEDDSFQYYSSKPKFVSIAAPRPDKEEDPELLVTIGVAIGFCLLFVVVTIGITIIGVNRWQNRWMRDFIQRQEDGHRAVHQQDRLPTHRRIHQEGISSKGHRRDSGARGVGGASAVASPVSVVYGTSSSNTSARSSPSDGKYGIFEDGHRSTDFSSTSSNSNSQRSSRKSKRGSKQDSQVYLLCDTDDVETSDV